MERFKLIATRDVARYVEILISKRFVFGINVFIFIWFNILQFTQNKRNVYGSKLFFVHYFMKFFLIVFVQLLATLLVQSNWIDRELKQYKKLRTWAVFKILPVLMICSF